MSKNVIDTKPGQCIDVNKKDGGSIRVCPTTKDGEIKVGDKTMAGCQNIETPKRTLRICNTNNTLGVKQG